MQNSDSKKLSIFEYYTPEKNVSQILPELSNLENELSNDDIKINMETINIFSLISILGKILEDNNIIIKLQLNEDNINIISMILKNHPDILNNISDDISKIINDKVIDISDIPEIILLLKDSVNLYSSLHDLKLTKEQIINFIKNIVILIIESDEIKINESNKSLIINLINISVKLLESEINLKKTFTCKCF